MSSMEAECQHFEELDSVKLGCGLEISSSSDDSRIC